MSDGRITIEGHVGPDRGHLDPAHAAITDHELAEQQHHFETEDFKEGAKAMAERRLPVFHRR